MDKHCPECGGVDHTRINECPHLTEKEKNIWAKARNHGYKLGYDSGYGYGYVCGKQYIRDQS